MVDLSDPPSCLHQAPNTKIIIFQMNMIYLITSRTENYISILVNKI
jgi:hypothetical protein